MNKVYDDENDEDDEEDLQEASGQFNSLYHLL